MRNLARVLVVLLTLPVWAAPLFAQQVYITNEPDSNLGLLNLSTRVLTTIYDIGAKPDDLTLNSDGQLLYTIPSTGTLNEYDPVTGTNTVLASGMKYARDLFIEPGGQTILIAINTGEIDRYNFATGTLVTLSKGLGAVDGVAYDQYGNLYAVVQHNTIDQINPLTGAVLNTLVLEPHSGINGADGLTYDPYTQSLWATHYGTTGKGFIQILTNASGPTGFNTFMFTSQLAGTAPDGIKSDGKGNLYVGAIARVVVYNIPTNTITQSIRVLGGADGVSLVPGTY